ncbi:YggT family protein [Thermosediminibacter litoriperuensis]|uniref:YggT family protein n=1 Tax=Thermosediminibacter litoriperuensis TaxID=291989 RepID=A0A5S5ASR8_9FIRM|nr:YggT family protein [Thermosediminibacter litoriperuensis]TYP54905.1 YggT family protein [Thermosediminibacter litoriperuensis]
MLLIRAIELFFRFIEFLIFIRVFMSWIPGTHYSPVYRFIYRVTEPVLEPFRRLVFRFLPPAGGYYLDFSPLLALFSLDIAQRLIISLLIQIIY